LPSTADTPPTIPDQPQFTEGQLQPTVVRALQGELDDNDIAGGVDGPECAMRVGKRDPVIADGFGQVAAAVGHAHGIAGESPAGVNKSIHPSRSLRSATA
jgi:hypothetical protein